MTSNFEEKLARLVVKLHEIDALKFGDFKMKVGINSPVYFDLRVIVSYPKVMEELSTLLWEFSKSNIDCQYICGVPYTALPIASLISVNANIPMLMRRKETKDYGTRKLIEGKFEKGDTCVIIEDVVTSGSSILDTYKDLKTEGLEVSEAIVVVDREQGGGANLTHYGLKMRSLCTLSQIMGILLQRGRVTQTTVDQVKTYIESTQIPLKEYLNVSPQVSNIDRLTISFAERAKDAKNAVAVKLFSLMSEKHTNLCLSADFTTCTKILEIAELVGKHICLLKIHADIISDFTDEFVQKLTEIAKEKNFLIIEDRKFADIGHVVGLQYSEGVHKISSWADLVTVHPISGPGILDGLVAALKKNSSSQQRGCFIVVEMSSQGNLNTQQYITGAMKFATEHPDFVAGVVCQSSSIVTSPGLVQLTPGVQLMKGGDTLGQQYNTPQHAMLNLGADVAVVGRGITEAHNASEAAAEIRAQLWEAYEKRISKSHCK